MPILSCRCVITHCERGTETARRRTWIAAHDFRALALAAAREIAATPDACAYSLFTPDIPQPGVFLEVVHDRASALVGPMGGPRPPDGCASDCFYPLGALLACLGFDDEDRYLAIVKHAGIWERASDAPVRAEHESAEGYRKRCEASEHVRVERARHEGMHVVRYPVAPTRWRAHDLEQVMALAYRLLPSSEPRWRESGTIVREEGPHDAAARHWLQVGRGEYVVWLALPRFPGRAVAEWLGRRRGEVALYHPIAQLERTARALPAAGVAPALANIESVHVDSLM